MTATELRNRNRDRRISTLMREYKISRAEAVKMDSMPQRSQGTDWEYARLNQARRAQQDDLDRAKKAAVKK